MKEQGSCYVIGDIRLQFERNGDDNCSLLPK